MIAGYVDAYGYLTYQTFLSFMSGNTTITGYTLGQRHLAAALPSLVAIVGFVGGATVGVALPHAHERQTRRIAFAIVAALLSVAIIVARFTRHTDLCQIAIVSIAMGIMNSTVTRVGSESVSLTFVTGTLSKIGSHLALAWARAPLPEATGPRDTHARRAGQLAALWCSFLVGALLAGVTTPHFAVWTLVPPVVVLFALSALETPVSPRSGKNAP
jgi:uncharacterized membrane protein YoaK (UPF0700 family)